MPNQEYVYKKNSLLNVVANQTVILKKQHIRNLPPKKESSSSRPTLSTSPEDFEDFYPSVNSYYPFTEDVDAFARVHHLLESRRCSDSLEKEEPRVFVNEYSSKNALYQYLYSFPVCFIVLGKPGLGEEELAKRLADDWKCVYIDPLTLLEDEIGSDRRPGQCIEFNLRCGRSIGIDVLIRLLARRIQRPDVMHRGFVCCGFPLIPNELYEEDPISSESAVFTVREIFEELLDQTLFTTDLSARVAVSIEEPSRHGSSEKKSDTGGSDQHASPSGYNIFFQWSLESAVCGPAEINNDLEKQLDFIFGLFREPFVIVYIHSRDSDVVTKRSNYFFDSYTNNQIDMQKVKMFYTEGPSNEALTDDLFYGGLNPFAENPTLRHIVKIPENLIANVNTQLGRYHNEIVNFLDFKVLQHDQQYYIKVDGRSYISQMVNNIKLRLQILPLQPVLVPKGFVNSSEDAGEDQQPDDINEISLEDAFRRFSKRNVVSPMHPWRWSNWGSFCPVSMFHGEYQSGAPKFAVEFAEKIYFLANESYYNDFVENPRMFLLPPFPKPGSNGFVFGPPLSGKSVVTKCLSYILNSKVLTTGEMHREYFNEVVVEHRSKVKQSAIAEALEILKQERLVESQEKTAEWERNSQALLSELIKLMKDSLEISMSSFALRIESSNKVDECRQKLSELNFPTDISAETVESLLKNNDFRDYLPDYLKEEPAEPSVHDPFVFEYANTKLDEIGLEELKKLAQENVYEIYSRSIRGAEILSEHNGWLIDGMTTDVNIIKQVIDEFPVHEVVVLITSDHDYLIEQFKNEKKEEFKNFRNFLLNINERDAAYRAPQPTAQTFCAEIVTELVDACGYEETEIDPEALLKKFTEDFEAYNQEITSTLNFLEAHDIHPVIIDIKNQTTEQVLEEMINKVRDKYRLSSSKFTEADRAEEMQQFLTLAATTEDEGEGGNVVTDEFIAKHRRYGDTHYYCPVTFNTKFVLWRGKEEFAAKFKDKIYLCANESNLNKFLTCPRKYLPETRSPKQFPPPRICVLGTDPGVTSMIAKKLARNLGVRYINFKKTYRIAVENLSSMSLMFSVKDQEIPEMISSEWLESWVTQTWFENPHVGFVVDGFPDKPHALEFMVSHEAIPDVILHVAMSREDNLRRLLEKTLNKWKKKVEEQRKEQEAMNLIVHEQWEDFRKTRYNELIEIKRQERYAKKIQENLEEVGDHLRSDTQISIDSIVEQQEHDEAMRILDEEFPEPEIEEDQETDEERVQTWTTQIDNNYDQFTESLEEVKTICDYELIPFVEINGEQEEVKIIRQAFIIGNNIKFRGLSFFERCYEVPTKTAEKLLEGGYHFLSSFGRLCPVRYYDGNESVHGYFAAKAKDKIYPVLHRKYIYFINGKENLARFFKNPLKYTSQENVNCPLIPLCVAAIAPPKSGKSSLASRFVRDLGLKIITRGEAIRYIISNPLYTNLNSAVEEVLRRGETLSDELVMSCVQAASFCGDCLTQGFFYDGFPNTISEMTQLSRLGLVPHLIFDLEISKDQLSKQASEIDRKLRYSSRFIDYRLKEWYLTQKQFRDWCDREYQNIYKLPVDRCIWGIGEHAKEVTLSVAFERKHYYSHVKLNWPLRLANMLVTPLEFLERQSSYKSYCPGCLYFSRRMKNGGEVPDRTGLIHYEKFFYWLCDEHIEAFLREPDRFLPPSNVLLPQELPERVVLGDDEEEPVEGGYCLFCYIKNIPHKVLMKGSSDYAVRYKGRLYIFDSPDCMTNFMYNPNQFCGLVINFREEEEKTALEYRNLPILGMLEQYLAEILVRSVHHTNVMRPIIPGLSISQAAAVFVGLNLKTRNPKTQHLRLYEDALRAFHERRSNLLKYLELMKKYLNPQVYYEEPDPPSPEKVEQDDEDEWR